MNKKPYSVEIRDIKKFQDVHSLLHALLVDLHDLDIVMPYKTAVYIQLVLKRAEEQMEQILSDNEVDGHPPF